MPVTAARNTPVLIINKDGSAISSQRIQQIIKINSYCTVEVTFTGDLLGKSPGNRVEIPLIKRWICTRWLITLQQTARNSVFKLLTVDHEDKFLAGSNAFQAACESNQCHRMMILRGFRISRPLGPCLTGRYIVRSLPGLL